VQGGLKRLHVYSARCFDAFAPPKPEPPSPQNSLLEHHGRPIFCLKFNNCDPAYKDLLATVGSNRVRWEMRAAGFRADCFVLVAASRTAADRSIDPSPPLLHVVDSSSLLAFQLHSLNRAPSSNATTTRRPWSTSATPMGAWMSCKCTQTQTSVGWLAAGGVV